MINSAANVYSQAGMTTHQTQSPQNVNFGTGYSQHFNGVPGPNQVGQYRSEYDRMAYNPGPQVASNESAQAQALFAGTNVQDKSFHMDVGAHHDYTSYGCPLGKSV
ncbi:hypothetical protein Pint_22297 [Pistacia integerrima]|uniref:Uncharacterized protein n=1 Tax=Pistacia integerrima TaxID=434235 RepID=A0ACC0YKF5_9ROSI|nr:hypothetical protein Pint_22297 [Pistacia integerrima]